MEKYLKISDFREITPPGFDGYKYLFELHPFFVKALFNNGAFPFQMSINC